MTNLEQTIIKKVHTFPPEKQRKLLEYAESMEDKEVSLKDKRRTIWDKVKDIIEEVPLAEWETLPTDGSINVDHYLYGSAKKTK